MPIVPRIADGCVSYPLWEALPFWSWRCLLYVILLAEGIGVTMIASMSPIVLIATVIGCVAGAVVYFVYTVADRYSDQVYKTDAIKAAAANEKRDLTVAEQLQVDKTKKLNKIYIYGSAVGIVLASGLTYAGVWGLGESKLGLDPTADWVLYAAVSFVCSIILSWILEEAVMSKIEDRTLSASKSDWYKTFLAGIESTGEKTADTTDTVKDTLVSAGASEELASVVSALLGSAKKKTE